MNRSAKSKKQAITLNNISETNFKVNEQLRRSKKLKKSSKRAKGRNTGCKRDNINASTDKNPAKKIEIEDRVEECAEQTSATPNDVASQAEACTADRDSACESPELDWLFKDDVRLIEDKIDKKSEECMSPEKCLSSPKANSGKYELPHAADKPIGGLKGCRQNPNNFKAENNKDNKDPTEEDEEENEKVKTSSKKDRISKQIPDHVFKGKLCSSRGTNTNMKPLSKNEFFEICDTSSESSFSEDGRNSDELEETDMENETNLQETMQKMMMNSSRTSNRPGAKRFSLFYLVLRWAIVGALAYFLHLFLNEKRT